jgi:hypothetical protein
VPGTPARRAISSGERPRNARAASMRRGTRRAEWRWYSWHGRQAWGGWRRDYASAQFPHIATSGVFAVTAAGVPRNHPIQNDRFWPIRNPLLPGGTELSPSDPSVPFVGSDI